jgi:hypothetical protein
MDDKMFMELAQEIDTMLATSSEKYSLLPLVYSSVVLARLMRFNDGNAQDFKSLISSIADKDNKPSQEDNYARKRIVH